MAVKKNTSYAVEIEDTEGTYKAPTSSSKYVQVTVDGAELTKSKELLDRNVYTGSLDKILPRVGQTQVAGSLAVEAKASSTEGGAPEYDALLRSALGSRRQNASTTTTKASGNTAAVLQVEDADITDFAVGDHVMVKMAGAYHVSPITAVSTTPGSATITLLVPHPSGDVTDSAVLSKFTTYTVADSSHPSFSVSKYLETGAREAGLGCKVTSMSLEGFATGQMPTFNFGFEGLDYTETLSAIPHTPAYDTAVPPIVLDARIYMDGTAVTVNEMSFSLENALGFKSSISASNGRTASQVTERTITGSLNPYKEDSSIANYTRYALNTPFSLFAYAKVPTGVAGQFDQVVAIYMPNCIITDLAEGDLDGILQDSISFSAHRTATGTPKQIYIAFI